MVSTLSGALSSQRYPRDLSLGDFCSVINHSSNKLFVDDVTIFKEINNLHDCSDLQKDLNAILDWSSKWLLRLNPEKCTALPITNKCHPIMYTYQLNGHPIIWSSVIRYLGVYISSFLKWTHHHYSHIAKRASNTFNLYSPCYVYIFL